MSLCGAFRFGLASFDMAALLSHVSIVFEIYLVFVRRCLLETTAAIE